MWGWFRFSFLGMFLVPKLFFFPVFVRRNGEGDVIGQLLEGNMIAIAL
jgi:hypothetical protein